MDQIPAEVWAYLPPDFYRMHPGAQAAAYRAALADLARFGPLS